MVKFALSWKTSKLWHRRYHGHVGQTNLVSLSLWFALRWSELEGTCATFPWCIFPCISFVMCLGTSPVYRNHRISSTVHRRLFARTKTHRNQHWKLLYDVNRTIINGEKALPVRLGEHPSDTRRNCYRLLLCRDPNKKKTHQFKRFSFQKRQLYIMCECIKHWRTEKMKIFDMEEEININGY